MLNLSKIVFPTSSWLLISVCSVFVESSWDMKEEKAIMHSTSGSPCLTSRLTGSISFPVISLFKLLFLCSTSSAQKNSDSLSAFSFFYSKFLPKLLLLRERMNTFYYCVLTSLRWASTGPCGKSIPVFGAYRCFSFADGWEDDEDFSCCMRKTRHT